MALPDWNKSLEQNDEVLLEEEQREEVAAEEAIEEAEVEAELEVEAVTISSTIEWEAEQEAQDNASKYPRKQDLDPTQLYLIQVLGSQFPNMSFKEIERAVKAVFMQMALALEHGQRIEIRGFGSFSIRYRAPRLARNPKTGEQLKKEGKFAPYFRAGKELRDRVNLITQEES